MSTTPNGWQILDEAAGVLTFEYSFGPGMASAFTAKIRDGELAVISPPCGQSAAVLDDLKSYGDVKVLVAPNGFHHMGIEQWKSHFPEAEIYAPHAAQARLNKKCSAGAVFSDLESLSLPDNLVIEVPPHLKAGEARARAQVDGGWIWYFNDLLTNQTTPPKALPLKVVNFLFRQKPGFQVFNFITKLMVKDKGSLKAYLLQEVKDYPPVAVVVGHGPPVTGDNIPAQLTTILEAGY